MSGNNESPIDPMYEPESAEGRRLAEIERRLKRARPLPVEFAATVLERRAGVAPTREAREPGRRRFRAAATVAASWVCGALVGAAAMFLAMSGGEAQTGSTPTIASEDKHGTPQVDIVRRENPEPASDGPADDWGLTEFDAAVLAMTVPGGTSPFLADQPRLQAGMCLPNLAARSAERLIAGGPVDEADTSDSSTATSPAPAGSYLAPSPGITREELMRDLLGESPEFVL